MLARYSMPADDFANTAVQIPARLASSRPPSKPLAKIAGVPMTLQIWQRAMEADIGPAPGRHRGDDRPWVCGNVRGSYTLFGGSRGVVVKRHIEGVSRDQGALFPDHLDDWIGDENAVRVIDAFVDELDLPDLGFDLAEATGRPDYHPSVLLKLYIYGYLNRVQSSRRLERETLRSVEVMWLLARLSPDHKTIADFRKDNGEAIRKVCAQFVELYREIGLPAVASVAIDGSKFPSLFFGRSTTAIGTLPRPRWSGGRSRSRRAYRAI